MPRILVADDNSNIQKMVTLALKDVGIDVVAVPNGEAAVRKLTDANLDLVLADIFMPVRSGYEVCEYIKRDPRYSHLPVVLLVGAFDPLDEREAQRVGADGILKKPFVPPDPLINMVKSLLAKSAAERLMPVAVAASSAEVAAPPLPRHVPDHAPGPLPDLPLADFPDIPPEEFAAPAGGLDFSNHESPLAFGSLLDAPATDESDLTVTASRDPVLGEPAFWSHPPAGETETNAQTEETSAEDVLQDHTWGHGQPIPFGIEASVLPSAEREAESFDTGDDLTDLVAEEVPEAASHSVELEAGHKIDFEAEPIVNHLAESVAAQSDESPEVHEPAEIPSIHTPSIHAFDFAESVREIAQAISFSRVEPSFASTAQPAEVATEAPPAEIAPTVAESYETPQEPSAPEVSTLPEPSPQSEASTLSETPTSSEASTLPETSVLSDLAEPAPEIAEISETHVSAAVETEPVAAKAPETETVETETFETKAQETGNHPAEAIPSVIEHFAPREPDPAPAELPAWMAAVATIVPSVESEAEHSFEHTAPHPMKSTPVAHAATQDTPEPVAATAPESNDERSERDNSENSHSEYNERKERSLHLVPTTQWPPAFEPHISDESLSEQPTSNRAFPEQTIFEHAVASAPAQISDFLSHAPESDHASNGAPAPESYPAATSVSNTLSSAEIAPPASSATQTQSPETIEAIVSRIVERMQPKVMDIVTREILRPLVEALVHREIEKR